jgi:signal transduction histidine kinase
VQSEQRLRQLSTRLLDVQERERRNLSRDLHDELGQLATVITLDLKRARSTPDAAKRDGFLDAALQRTAELLDSMHRLTARLRSSTLDDLGLHSSVKAYASELEQRGALEIDLRLEFDESDVPGEVAIHVLRIVQEALTNVVRHAQSRRVFVSISHHEVDLEICVEDQGIGFDPLEIPTDRLGLLGIQERVELLGGSFQLRAAPGRGTILRARIPLGSDRHAVEGSAVA